VGGWPELVAAQGLQLAPLGRETELIGCIAAQHQSLGLFWAGGWIASLAAGTAGDTPSPHGFGHSSVRR